MDKAGGMASTPKSTASTPAPGSERVKTLRCMRSLPPGLPPLEWRDEIRASCGCTHGDPLHAGARLNRGAVADARVQALPIVEDFDVVEHRRLRLLADVEADLVDVLRLEGGEEALHGRIIEAVAAPAHGLGDTVPLQHGAVGLGGVLHATVAMVEQPRWRVMVLEGHDQRVDAEPGLQVVRHGPADDLARGHVLDGGQIQETLA